MNKKLFLLLIGLFFVFGSVSVFGALNSSLVEYYSMEKVSGSILIGELNYKNGTIKSGNTNTTGKILDGRLSDASKTNQYINLTNTNFGITNNLSFNIWVKWNKVGGNVSQSAPIFSKWGSGNVWVIWLDETNRTNPRFYLNVGGVSAITCNVSVTNGSWNMITTTYNNINRKIYINGTLCGQDSKTGNIATGTDSVVIQGYQPSDQETNATVDELGVWNRELSQAEIIQLYNDGNGFAYPFLPISNFTITDKNNFNNASILNFSALINGTVYNTTTGTITTQILSNSTLLWNITIFSNNMFNKSYLDVNVSSGLSATQDQFPIVYLTNIWNNSNLSVVNVSIDNVVYSSVSTFIFVPFNESKNVSSNLSDYLTVTSLFNLSANGLFQLNVSQSVINFSLVEFDNNVSLSNFTLNVSGYGVPQGCNTTLSWCLLYPNVGVYNYSVVDNTGVNTFTPINNSFSVGALDNKTVVAFVTEHWINVTAKNIVTGVNISNFSIHLTDLTDATDVRDFNTTNGFILIPVIHHTYNLTILSSGYAVNNNYAVIVVNTSISSNSIINKTFFLYTTNSINLTFIDALSLNIINTSLDVEFIGNTRQTNTTSTGNLYVDLLSPDDYTIITNGSGYVQNTYLLSLINQTYNPITIYMQPSSNATYYVLFNVIDKLSRQPLQGAVVTIQRYINNSWVTEQIYTTDFNGRGQGYFTLNTEYYNFVITYNGIVYSGVLNSDANKKIIYYQDYLDGLGIEISLSQTNYINTIQDLYSVNTALKYVNVSNSSGYFVYSWQDINGNSRLGNISVYLNGILNCSSSAQTSTGSINCFVNASNQELVFNAYSWIDNIPDKTMSQKVGVSEEWNFEWGIGGWIFTIFLVIIAFTAFAQVPAISILLGSLFFALALFFNILFNPDAGLSQYGIIVVFVAFLIAKIPSNSGVNS